MVGFVPFMDRFRRRPGDINYLLADFFNSSFIYSHQKKKIINPKRFFIGGSIPPMGTKTKIYGKIQETAKDRKRRKI